MPSLDWPAMTMEFGVADRSLLRGLKPGDRVEFELSARQPGEYVVDADRARRQSPSRRPPARAPGALTMLARLIEWSARNAFLVLLATAFTAAGASMRW